MGRMRMAGGALALMCLVSGCSHGFNADVVLAFVDRADQAFLEGRGSDICNMRAKDFKLVSTTYELAAGEVVADLAAAEAIEAEKADAGRRLEGRRDTMDLQEFCFNALAQQKYFKRASMERTSIHVEMSPDGKSAEVRAHYVIREPMYANGESSISTQDQVERQVSTLQTESDDVSVVTTNEHGELVFASTTTVNKSFQVAKERDSRL